VPAEKSEKVAPVEKSKIVKGKVVNSGGKPLEGAVVVVYGGTAGVATNKNGEFKLEDVPKDGGLVFSYVGMVTIAMKPDFKNPMTIKMVPATVGLDKVVVIGYGNDKTLPPPTRIKIDSIDSENPPLYVVDGVITEKRRAEYFIEVGVESVNVLKGKSATELYGDKAKNGVIMITSKKNPGAANGKIEEDVKVIGYGLQKDHKPIGTRFISYQGTTIGSNYPENPPLFVLDGVIIDKAQMDTLNNKNIASIYVLKDKSATDKYGDKGKNGVIQITSKGKAGAANSNNKDNNVRIGHPLPSNGESSFIVVETMPEFPGGKEALMKFIQMNIKYPAEAQKANAQGKVFVSFVITRAGKVENAKVVSSVYPALDAEALRLVNSMPDWKPGCQRGKAVDLSYMLPIEFTLQ